MTGTFFFFDLGIRAKGGDSGNTKAVCIHCLPTRLIRTTIANYWPRTFKDLFGLFSLIISP